MKNEYYVSNCQLSSSVQLTLGADACIHS